MADKTIGNLKKVVNTIDTSKYAVNAEHSVVAPFMKEIRTYLSMPVPANVLVPPPAKPVAPKPQASSAMPACSQLQASSAVPFGNVDEAADAATGDTGGNLDVEQARILKFTGIWI